LLSRIWLVADRSIKGRKRQPRVEDNPMAQLARHIMIEAKDAFRTADELGAAMEPHLLQQVTNSAIYQYTTTNTERKRNVPPGDVLLAAALAAGLSLDEQLGMVRQANDIELLRAQLAEMRQEMASLRAMVAGDGTVAKQPAAEEIAAAKADRASRRRAWAERSPAATTSAGVAPPPPRSRRTARR
jgi:hypothetical protein